jgi:septal ring factor EnvC (AmiA/AmiB activator)
LETRAALESERQARTTADANTNALVAMTQNALAQESAALVQERAALVQERAALAQERAAHAKTQLTLDNERAAHAVTRAERNEAVQAAILRVQGLSSWCSPCPQYLFSFY